MTDKDDSTIDLSKLDGDEASLEVEQALEEDDSLKEIGGGREEFKIHHLDEKVVGKVERVSEDELRGVSAEGVADGEVGEIRAVSPVAVSPADKVKIKFDKFVTLVATHTYEDILRKDAHEDVIISTNLLTDLANAHDEGGIGGKKLPLLFLVGLVLGVLVTWLILKT